MESREKVDKLFLELSSESRLDLLRELEAKELRMGELARRLHLTATEATRQLRRLTEALLIRRLPEGAYAATPYGQLVLHLSPALEFVSRHKEYFATRDLSTLPYPFVDRIGELSQGTLNLDMLENVRSGEQMMGRAERHFWGLVPGPGNELMTPIVQAQIRKGVGFRFVVPKGRLEPDTTFLGTPQQLEARGLPDIPLTLGLSEKEAVVAFRPVGGRWDYAGFHGSDAKFLEWTKDVFLYCWDQTKRVPVV